MEGPRGSSIRVQIQGKDREGKTSPGSHSSFPGWASNPFPGSRPCKTLTTAPVSPLQPPPTHGASLPYPPAMLALLQALRQGPSTSSPQGLGISCCSESLECFLPYPLGCPLSDHTSPFRSVSGSQGGLPALGGRIPLPLLQTLIRSVIPSYFSKRQSALTDDSKQP